MDTGLNSAVVLPFNSNNCIIFNINIKNFKHGRDTA